MSARVAFVGEGSVAAWRGAIDAMRTRFGSYVSCVAEEYAPPAGVSATLVVSYYSLDPVHHGARAAEMRDRDLLSGVDAVVRFDDSGGFRVDEKAKVAVETPKSHQWLWLDFETTGLDPASGGILEFAAVLCEDAAGDDFAIVQQYSGVVHCDSHAGVDPYVARMHDANGLWAEAAASTTSIAEVDAFLAALCASLTDRPRSISLAGSSVHFDLAWARVHLPQFAAYLSHRVLDVSTLRAAANAWSPTPIEWPKRDAHRALADILATIEEARVARSAMGWAK
jgi:oligoribonuclease